MIYLSPIKFSIKKLIMSLALIVCFSKTFAQDITVDFEGSVTNDDSTLSEVIVQVMQNGKLLTTFKTDNSGSYNIYLPIGSDYLIAISKNNYVQKYFTVSTKGIPLEQTDIKFPTIRADVDLFKYYEGVDYSLFDEPVNKFYYNSKAGNFEYDKDLLKKKKAAMKLVKLAEKRAILLALQKNKIKQKELEKTPNKKEESDQLVKEKESLDKKLVKENLLLKLIEEDKPLLKSKRNNNEVKLNIVAADNAVSKKIIDKKINDLVTKYKQGVTEERQEGQGVVIIKRILVRENEVWVYEKKIFDWGGVSYFRDKQRITASTFNMETAGK